MAGKIIPGKIIPYNGIWTRSEVEADYPNIYVFGDNTSDSHTNYVPHTTQAVIRGLRNAVGIITKHDRFLNKKSFLSDEEWFDYSDYIHDKYVYLYDHLTYGQNVYVPMKDGKILIGTGKAQLPTKAPECYKILCEMFEKLFNEFGGKDGN